MLHPPPALPAHGILVGYSLEHERRQAPIGFSYGNGGTRGAPLFPGSVGALPDSPGPAGEESAHLAPILHTGGGHLLTIAPTGAGKGVSCIIPTLLRFPGPVIVIDPKGENAAVTAERRREMGQEVVILDPMGITGASPSAALNPLDLIDPLGPQAIDDAAMLASLLGGGIEREDPRNLFWHQKGEQLLTGIIQYVATELDPEQRNLSEVARILNLPSDDFTGFARHHMARSGDPDVRQVAGTLVNPAQEMIGSIVAMAQNTLGFLRGRLVHGATARSTFDLDGVTRGDPLSIYLVIPPDKLQSHRSLLRVWVGVLMAALLRRRAPLPHNTLFVLDEAAQLGPLEQLRQAVTLLRGYGLQTWSFWQDQSQLRNLYPLDWQTMYNNCRVHQAFGFSTVNAAMAISELTGFHDPLEALRLDPDEMLLSISGDETVIAQKPNYLGDPAFAGLFAENPFYTGTGERAPAPRRSQRRYRRPERGRGGSVPITGEEVSEAGEPNEAGSDQGRTDEVEADLPGTLWGELGGEDAEGPSVARFFPFDGESAPDHRPPFLVPGGLNPFAGTGVVDASEVPSFLQKVEVELGEPWPRYRTLVRLQHLLFCPLFRLYELNDPKRAPSRDLVLRTGSGVRHFHGGPRALKALAAEARLAQNSSGVALYAEFFLHFTRGRPRPVRVVWTLEQVAYWTGRDPEELESVTHTLDLDCRRDDEEGGWITEGTALVGGDLCSFRVRVGVDGALGPLECETLLSELGPEEVVEVEVLGVPGLGAIHGAWQVIPEPERADLLGWLDAGEKERVRGGAPPVRRVVACYPGMDLVCVPAGDGGPPLLLLWCGTRPARVTPPLRSAINERFLSVTSPEEAAECSRIFGWLRASEDYPIVLLEEVGQLEALLVDGAELDPEERRRVEAAWIPMRVREVEPEEQGVPLFHIEFMLVEADKLLRMAVVMGADGELRSATEDGVTEALPVDRNRLDRARDLPLMAGGSERADGTASGGSATGPGTGG